MPPTVFLGWPDTAFNRGPYTGWRGHRFKRGANAPEVGFPAPDRAANIAAFAQQALESRPRGALEGTQHILTGELIDEIRVTIVHGSRHSRRRCRPRRMRLFTVPSGADSRAASSS